jgi:hypothetical protein
VRYEGFGAYCAGYAFLNTTNCEKVSPEEYELLSGVPFGIKHIVGDSHRMLTPFFEPCFRVEFTAELLGFSSQYNRLNQISDSVEYISKMPTGSRVMLGPIDMGCLLHLPQNLYYKGESHYISIEIMTDNDFVIIDSEGVIAFKYDKKSLLSALSVESIPESGGCLNIWSFSEAAGAGIAPSEYRSLILKYAVKNMGYAEQAGEGSQSFTTCYKAIEFSNPAEWGLKLFHGLNFQIQRKSLFLECVNKWRLNGITDIIYNQINILCSLRECALKKKRMSFGDFENIATYERELLNQLNAIHAREV